MKARVILSVVACLMMTVAAVARGNRDLKVGSPAPGLEIEKWVKGKETKLEQGKVYVVEFWATWCKPCQQSIPHLTEIQDRYADKGLTVIGISDEEVGTIEPFVKAKGKQMEYTVAADRRKGTNRSWMEAAGKNGIPCAFIVDKAGKIAYIGHPLADEFEPTLVAVLSGRFDPAMQAAAQPVLDAARSAAKVRSWRMAAKQYDEVLNKDPKLFATVGLERFQMTLVDQKAKDEAYAYAKTQLIGKAFANDAEALTWLASKIATDPNIDAADRDMDVALAAAQRAQQITGEHSPEGLAAVAMVRFHRGELTQAIDLQKEAYFSAVPKQKADYKRTLDMYVSAAQRNEQASMKQN
ncbi:MAG TPA: TlpA disulfide reductase family protein [Phycisphaerales bacterium]|nr:TlpA disulfide reductase family protein [Phycisphaerales bacterium]